MDDVTFGRNGRDVEAALCSDSHERRGDTEAESDVYECLLALVSSCRLSWLRPLSSARLVA